jgi:imidazolonepropionase-like amidohydrolase
LKFMVTGGAGTPHMELTQVLMTANELAAAVGEARTRGKRTLAHATNPQGVLQCVEAGVDSIDHGNVLDNAALDAMKKAGSFYTPTIYVYYALATTGAKAGGSEWAVQKAKGIVDSHKDAFQKAYRMGINIATGTDLGSVSTDRVGLLGEGLFSEIELMVKYGMAPMDAIKSATHTSARNLGVEKVVGTLQKDKLADLVIIDGNPLEDISHIRRVWRVMKEGQIVYEV